MFTVIFVYFYSGGKDARTKIKTKTLNECWLTSLLEYSPAKWSSVRSRVASIGTSHAVPHTVPPPTHYIMYSLYCIRLYLSLTIFCSRRDLHYYYKLRPCWRQKYTITRIASLHFFFSSIGAKLVYLHHIDVYYTAEKCS